MKRPAPYLAVTGVASFDDAVALCRLRAKHTGSRRLVAGVLVSAATLRGECVESLRYPPFRVLGRLLPMLALARWIPAVHFNSRATGEELEAELATLAELSCLRMLQLNLTAPSVGAIARFRARAPDVEVVVQLNPATLAAADSLRGVVYRYGPVAEHGLLDASRGTGCPFDVEQMARSIFGVEDTAHRAGVRLGVAGGLNEDPRDPITALRAEIGDTTFAALSFDVETGVRTAVPGADTTRKGQDRLDPAKVSGYLASFSDFP